MYSESFTDKGGRYGKFCALENTVSYAFSFKLGDIIASKTNHMQRAVSGPRSRPSGASF